MPAEDLPTIFLVGYRGSGKSSVGQELADRLGRSFIDADRWLEACDGRSIRRIFDEEGELAFRDLEEEVLAGIIEEAVQDADDAPASGRRVVATGGGCVLRPRNVERLREAGVVVWLTAPAGTLAARIAGDRRSGEDRPPLSGPSADTEVEEVLARRAPLYRAAAHASVETEGLAPGDVADRVLEAVRGWVRERRGSGSGPGR